MQDGQISYAFTALRDPRPYGNDWAEFIDKQQPEIILVDETSGTPSGHQDLYGHLSMRRPALAAIQGPDTRPLADYVSRGGRLVLSCPHVDRWPWDTYFYQDVLGLKYGQRSDRSYKFHLADANEPEFEILTQREGQTVRLQS